METIQTLKELKEFIEKMPDGTVASIELKVVVENG